MPQSETLVNIIKQGFEDIEKRCKKVGAQHYEALFIKELLNKTGKTRKSIFTYQEIIDMINAAASKFPK